MAFSNVCIDIERSERVEASNVAISCSSTVSLYVCMCVCVFVWTIPRVFPILTHAYHTQSSRIYCLGLSDEVNIIHNLLPVNTSSLVIKADKAGIEVHDISPEIHVQNVLLIWQLLLSNFSFSKLICRVQG